MMKMIVTLILGMVLAIPMLSSALTIEGLELEARSRVPHNERVIDNRSTIYILEAGTKIKIHPHLYTELHAVSYGVQTWRPNPTNGRSAWSTADWGISGWRPSWDIRIGVPIKWGFELIGAYGRCLWCTTPQGRYFGEFGVRWDVPLFRGLKLFE